MYKCIKCGNEMDALPIGTIRCSSCSFKILVKRRSQVTKTIKAR